jgi:hypothetical protein
MGLGSSLPDNHQLTIMHQAGKDCGGRSHRRAGAHRPGVSERANRLHIREICGVEAWGVVSVVDLQDGMRSDEERMGAASLISAWPLHIEKVSGMILGIGSWPRGSLGTPSSIKY